VNRAFIHMKIEIKDWLTDEVLFSGEYLCIAAAVVEAVQSGVSLERASLANADLRGSILVGALFDGANLENVNLCGVDLTRASLVMASLKGAELIDANLNGSDLTLAHLEGAELTRANLEGVDFSSANLDFATLRNSYLVGANFEGAMLTRTDLRGANLKGSKLDGANLNLAKLTGANLCGALYAYAQVAFGGYGGTGGMLTGVRLKKGENVIFFHSDHFAGSAKELRDHICNDAPRFRKSRTLAMDTVLSLIDEKHVGETEEVAPAEVNNYGLHLTLPL
jgi:uncharacterized protein YjbI with pentapeptide repeats